MQHSDACLYMYIYMCIYIYMYIYIQNIYTHIHTSVFFKMITYVDRAVLGVDYVVLQGYDRVL